MRDPITRSGPHSDRVSQATGMISVQADCSLAEAFDLLRERAFGIGQTLEMTALDAIDHIIRFGADADSN